MKTRTFIAAVGILIPSIALAVPAEDHWSPALPPQQAEALAESVRILETEEYCQALPILEDLALALPENADVFNLLGYVYRKMDDLETSAAHYSRALTLDPNHLGALEYQGELFLKLGQTERAGRNLARLERLCPGGCDERTALAEAIAAQPGVE